MSTKVFPAMNRINSILMWLVINGKMGQKKVPPVVQAGL